MIYTSHSPEDTEKIAAEFARTLRPNDVVAMYGDLGAGKTAFAKGVARALGVTAYVTSPTFTIVNEYKGNMPFYHFDAYRIGSSEEMYDIGFEDYIYAGGVSLIEWSELIEDILPDKRYRVTIEKSQTDDNTRTITIERQGGE